MEKKVVFITGASSGFGLALAKMYIKDGFSVYGVGLTPFELEGLNFYPCDVSDYDAMKAIVDDVVEREGKIDIVVSNAGMGISGSVENTEVMHAKKQMAVNFFGNFNCIKACLPILRQQNSGRMLFTSSVASVVPIPYQGFYSASKSALDSLISATRAEIHGYNIKLVSIQPGDAKTGFTANRTKSQNEQGYDNCEKSVKRMEKDEEKGMTAEKVAKAMYKASLQKRPPLRKIVGGKYKFYCFVLRLLPLRMREWAVRKFY